MVEKRRRDRMNNCLDQLKSLLAVKVKNNVSLLTAYFKTLTKSLGNISMSQKDPYYELPLLAFRR